MYRLRAQLACFGNWATSRLLKHKRINLIKSFGSLNPSMPQRYSEIITPVLVELSKRWSKSCSSSLWHNSSSNLFGHPLSLQDSTCWRDSISTYLQRTCFSANPSLTFVRIFLLRCNSNINNFILDSLLPLPIKWLINTSDECGTRNCQQVSCKSKSVSTKSSIKAKWRAASEPRENKPQKPEFRNVGGRHPICIYPGSPKT